MRRKRNREKILAEPKFESIKTSGSNRRNKSQQRTRIREKKEGKTTSVCVREQRVFPFFAPMRSFIKDLSNLHTDFFSSSSGLSLFLSLFL
jgi:hypothetical protein